MSSNNSIKLEEFRLHQRFQWIALTAIDIEKKNSPSDLAEHIGVSRPAISRMLKQMEAIDLIERSLIGDDGRTRQLSLTDKGRNCMNLCWPHVQETEQYFLDKVSESQREALCLAVHALMLGEAEALY